MDAEGQEGVPLGLPELTHVTLQEHDSHLSFHPDFDHEVLQTTMESWNLSRLKVEYRH